MHRGELLALAIGSDEASSNALNIQGEDTARATAVVLCVCLVMCTFMRVLCACIRICVSHWACVRTVRSSTARFVGAHGRCGHTMACTGRKACVHSLGSDGG